MLPRFGRPHGTTVRVVRAAGASQGEATCITDPLDLLLVVGSVVTLAIAEAGASASHWEADAHLLARVTGAGTIRQYYLTPPRLRGVVE